MPHSLTAGDPAPAFSLPDEAGGSRSLADFAGKKLVLYFYPQDNTPTCTQEAIDFNRLKGAFQKAETEIVGISPDPLKSHSKFKTKHALDLTLLSDEQRAVLEAYGVWKEKVMFGNRYMGVERTTFLIDAQGKIAQVWNKVRIKGHAEAVLQAAEALG
ncbi:thioredoxin-dependent thiol peroxidase [Methylovirgula sp. 4M-Z18]|uniref:thioredoxin-dependent thiol peroxidase n=1 Tax=Methylovirgula sp. 4M-Z18 TaxID=2293567 RepID=UPI000E2EFA9B|nr:thioredoxin-dependent thiol peroxidase [Methylovirgula sp. 4M-Z18]RFB80798.1 thioredoxin-dependent thiol peroxidase [Methylovirgula sp. 4M-Z18]